MFQNLSYPLGNMPGLQQDLGSASQSLLNPFSAILPIGGDNSCFDINIITGPPGPQGVAGPTGATGPIGQQGPAGSGATGTNGLDGSTGLIGLNGATGLVGTGTNGLDGCTGITGLTGATGSCHHHDDNIRGIISTSFVTDSPYIPTSEEHFLATDEGVKIILPSDCKTGKVYIVKDFSGKSKINNIIISSESGNIDGVLTKVINKNFGSITFIFNSVEWSTL
jgi:hypothetical protein